MIPSRTPTSSLWVQPATGDHCLAFSNQSTGLGEIRQANKTAGMSILHA